MSTFDDPNREAVGLAPIWEGAEGEPPPEGNGEPEAFDPGEYTVDEVKAYVDENPDELARVTKAERKGKGRATLLDWLNS